MEENGRENVVMVALFMVTKDDVLACADELGMSKEQVTDDVIEQVKEKVSHSLGGWKEVLRGMVKEAIRCPLGLTCSPSCAWREVGGCALPKEAK